MWAIAQREWASYLKQPLTWLMLALLQVVFAWFFLVAAEGYLQARDGLTNQGFTAVIVIQLYSQAVAVLWLIVPLLSMHLISSERRQGSLPLLLAAPLRMHEIVLGKYLAVLGFCSLLLGLLWLMPASLWLGGLPDWGMLFGAWLGLLGLVISFSAIGLYFSTLSPHPALAALGSVCVILLFWRLDWHTGADADATPILQQLSFAHHFTQCLKGQIGLHDVLYFVLVSGVFLSLSWQRLQRLRR